MLAALQGRERTGRGQRVDVNQLQATMSFMNEPYAGLFATGKSSGSLERPRASGVFTFTCSDDKPIAIHLSSPTKFWKNFVTACGHSDMVEDPRFKGHEDRTKNHEIIQATLGPEFRKKTRSEWMRILDEADVPFAPIYTLAEAMDDPQARHLGMMQTAMHPERGKVNTLGYPVTLSDTPLGPVVAPAMLGEHTNQVLAEMGYSAKEIEQIREEGALGPAATG